MSGKDKRANKKRKDVSENRVINFPKKAKRIKNGCKSVFAQHNCLFRAINFHMRALAESTRCLISRKNNLRSMMKKLTHQQHTKPDMEKLNCSRNNRVQSDLLLLPLV
jgi:hypothetical protein